MAKDTFDSISYQLGSSKDDLLVWMLLVHLVWVLLIRVLLIGTHRVWIFLVRGYLIVTLPVGILLVHIAHSYTSLTGAPPIPLP